MRSGGFVLTRARGSMRKLLSSLAVVLATGVSLAADLSITAGSVLASSQATIYNGTAGATITAGQVVYRDASDSNKIKLADADASATASRAFGIALNGASSGQPVRVVTADPALTVGATLSLTAPVYVLSGTAGGIAPIADMAAADYPVVLMVATSTSVAIFNPTALAGTTLVASP